MRDVSDGFLEASATFLSAEFLPRIHGAVEALTDDDVWWRPNESSNSVGNLLMHLAGNVRQWVVSGVGGAPDTRTRQQEFDARDPLPTHQLLEQLDATVTEAVGVLRGVQPERLLDRIEVQGRSVTVLEAIYHVVEHFSMHTGQILYIAKLRSGRDLGFYELVDGIPRARWEGQPRH